MGIRKYHKSHERSRLSEARHSRIIHCRACQPMLHWGYVLYFKDCKLLEINRGVR